MKADALSRCPGFNTGNSANNHLILLPFNQFKGMPKSITKKLRALSQSNSTPEFTLMVAKTENPSVMNEDLDAQVKLY
jgi:hypothetical protein